MEEKCVYCGKPIEEKSTVLTQGLILNYIVVIQIVTRR